MNCSRISLLGWMVFVCPVLGADFGITSFSRDREIRFVHTLTQGVVTIERALTPAGGWLPEKNILTTDTQAVTRLPDRGPASFYRGVAIDLTPGSPNGRPGFTNLTRVYGLLTTIAGAGNGTDNNTNFWQPQFEGGLATAAELSRPHIAMADAAGNVYIADKWAHAIRKVTPDGRIVTVAGTNDVGNAPDTPTLGTAAGLSEPNGLWVQPDGTVYILDIGNHKIRKLDANGVMTTVFTDPNFIFVGRGLFVTPDASEIYYTVGTVIRKWASGSGISTFSTGYIELGNLHRNPITGDIIATDRDAHQVYRVETDGARMAIAGNGLTFGGSDGGVALEAGLNEVRTAWFLPTGGYFLGTHRGSQVWYVDPDGFIHLFLNGLTSDTHAGDGTWFYNLAEFRVSEVRAITVDHDGNLLITEHDAGYVRKVEFLPFTPQD